MAKKISNRKKGRVLEIKVEKQFNKLGFTTWRPPATKFQSQDIFGVGDILAISKKGIKNTLALPNFLLIQVKSNVSDFYKARSQMRTFEQEHTEVGIGWCVIVPKTEDIMRLWLISFGFERDFQVNLVKIKGKYVVEKEKSQPQKLGSFKWIEHN